MSFQSTHVTELRAEESRCLGKIEAKTKSLQAANPLLSYGQAYCQAVQSMPNVYASYDQVRQQLVGLNVRPQLPSGLSQG